MYLSARYIQAKQSGFLEMLSPPRAINNYCCNYIGVMKGEH